MLFSIADMSADLYAVRTLLEEALDGGEEEPEDDT
jgi:hypothetical protein